MGIAEEMFASMRGHVLTNAAEEAEHWEDFTVAERLREMAEEERAGTGSKLRKGKMENLALALQVRDNIRQDLRHFDMTTWGTRSRFLPDLWTACLAGHTLLAAGYTLNGEDEFSLIERKFRFFTRTVYVKVVKNAAQELLGLTEEEMNLVVPCNFPFTGRAHQCHLFCGFISNDTALANFDLVIEREQARRSQLVAP